MSEGIKALERRIEKMEIEVLKLNTNVLERQNFYNTALGEAIYASTIGFAAFRILAKSLPIRDVIETIDELMLSFERRQATTAGGPGALQHVHARLAAVLEMYRRQVPPDEPTA